MLTLQDFDREIEPKIVRRGEDYFANGLVEALWREDEGWYGAVVDGTEPYDVAIRLDERGRVREHSCDCPYDWGEYCKHEVAVLLAIRQHRREKAPLPAQRQGKRRGLRGLLETCGKDALVELLLELANAYELREVVRYYLREYGCADEEPEAQWDDEHEDGDE